MKKKFKTFIIISHFGYIFGQTKLSNQPRIETKDGNLLFTTESNKNIQFITKSGNILVNSIDLEASLTNCQT